jgi:hypothetical protein
MGFIEIREKYGERMLSMVATDIVLQGLRSLQERYDDRSALGREMKACIEDINSGSWDEIRAVIKRTL